MSGTTARETPVTASQGTGPGGKKDDSGKTAFHLVPFKVIEGLARVLTFGAGKYAPNSWQKVPEAIARYRSGGERHWKARVFDGEILDQESGIEHAWHYFTNHMFVAWFLAFRPSDVAAYRAAECEHEEKT